LPSLHPHPELFVDTEWLASHREDPGIRIVDCDWPQGYAKAHIPGAVGHRNVNIFLKTGMRSPDDHELLVMGPDQFAALAGQMGIGAETHVVAYDNRMGSYAARLVWTLALYGHTRASVVDGGWAKWLEEGRPVTQRFPRVEPTTFVPRRDDSWLATADHVKAAIGAPNSAILDVRAAGEFTGSDARGNRRRGHIPGAVHTEWSDLLGGQDKVMRPANEVLAHLASLGVTPDKQVITHCQAGIRASHSWLVLRALGFGNVRMYDGSMAEWANRDDTALEV
jgi:thiosulfate/3-mercaptopyruvate sulfurtransferase